MDYIFVYKNRGWWLKIDNLTSLADYFQNVEEHRFTKGVFDDIDSKEFGNSTDHADNLAYYIGSYASNRKMSIAQAASKIVSSKMQYMIDEIYKGYNVYINHNGGWHFGKNDYKEWVRKDRLVFPDFKKDQIKIKKFTGGQHFYAYIDDMQLRNGDTFKWNTYEEAYDYAIQFVSDLPDEDEDGSYEDGEAITNSPVRSM